MSWIEKYFAHLISFQDNIIPKKRDITVKRARLFYTFFLSRVTGKTTKRIYATRISYSNVVLRSPARVNLNSVTRLVSLVALIQPTSNSRDGVKLLQRLRNFRKTRDAGATRQLRNAKLTRAATMCQRCARSFR